MAEDAVDYSLRDRASQIPDSADNQAVIGAWDPRSATPWGSSEFPKQPGGPAVCVGYSKRSPHASTGHAGEDLLWTNAQETRIIASANA